MAQLTFSFMSSPPPRRPLSRLTTLLTALLSPGKELFEKSVAAELGNDGGREGGEGDEKEDYALQGEANHLAWRFKQFVTLQCRSLSKESIKGDALESKSSR